MLKKILFILAIFIQTVTVFSQTNGNFTDFWIIPQNSATTNQAIVWNGTRWAPGNVGSMTAVGVTTNQGVSGVSSGGATPNLTISLGALTGVTSFNGLVVTANTGVITTGTWNGQVVGAAFGGTGFGTYVIGDLLFANTTSTLAKLAAGTAGFVLTSNGTGTAPSWQSAGSGGYSGLREEGGATITARTTLNFVGSAFTVADNVGSAWSELTADSDLNALASTATTGLYAVTAVGTSTTRTILGTTNRLNVTNGSGVGGDPTLDIASTYVGQASITTLGTIATGVWNGTVIGATFGGTGQTTVTTGDILAGTASNTWGKLAAVAAGSILKSAGVGVLPVWGTLASTDLSNTANIALLNATQTFTGATNTFNNAVTVNVSSTRVDICPWLDVTANTTQLAGNDSWIRCNIAVAGSTIQLPAEANITDGEIIFIWNINSNPLDVSLGTSTLYGRAGTTAVIDIPVDGHVKFTASKEAGQTHWQISE